MAEDLRLFDHYPVMADLHWPCIRRAGQVLPSARRLFSEGSVLLHAESLEALRLKRPEGVGSLSYGVGPGSAARRWRSCKLTIQTTVRRSATFLLLVLLIGSSGCERTEETRPPLSFVLETESAFDGHVRTKRFWILDTIRVFDVVATDMDLDGDPDVFLNRHHLDAWELFENTGGRFERVNPEGRDRSGLYDNRGTPALFGETREVVAGIEANAPPGLYVWHDTDRKGFWRFQLRGGADVRDVELSLHTNWAIQEIEGLDEVDYEKSDPFDMRVALGQEHWARTFGVRSAPASQLKLSARRADGRPLDLFLGRRNVPIRTGDLELWKADPHGVAWVQAESSPEPDLFVTRGAMMGRIRPPREPKRDAFYVWQGQPDELYRMAPDGFVPRNYGRGRQVQWVDLDNDGSNELYVGSKQTPNSLLDRDPRSGFLRDRASELGLAFVCGESFAWMDWDDDGFQDLIFLCDGRLALARNLGGSRFEVRDGRDLGLVIPKTPQSERLFDYLTMHVFDFDADGHLDLWLSGEGEPLANRVFLRRGAGFRDVTAEAGLTSIIGTRSLLVFDADNDGSVDALSLGERNTLLRNLGGGRFEAESADGLSETEPLRAGAATDVDGDGRIDLVLMGKRLQLARNVTQRVNDFLAVHLGPSLHEPVGAVVRAHASDGRVQAQRYGSSSNTTYSQTLQPLHFGSPAGTRIESVSVRWPGALEGVSYRVEPTQRVLRLEPLAGKSLP